jgi:CHAT domain-containing protein
MLLVGTPIVAAQAPGASPPRQQPPAPQPNQRAEQDRLGRQVEELRRAGRFDEAVAVAERALELERGTGEAMRGQVAEALARLAELHELRGDWIQAVGCRKEALAIRMQVDGKEHWRTADARLALAFAETVAGLGQADRAKVGGALRREQEAAQFVALEALETYRALVGPESAEVARVWHRIGRCRWARHDAGGAKQSYEQALAIRRKSLPLDHPLIAYSLNNLGMVQSELREYAAAKQSHEQALVIFRKSLSPDHPDIAHSLNNLGIVQSDLREYAAAKQSHEQALAICRKSLPPNPLDIAFSLLNLGLQGLKSGVGVGDAVPGLADATDLLQAEQLRLAVAQAEQEQLATAAMARSSLGILLSATLITRAEPASAYDHVVHVKGSVTAQQRWARQARDAADPDTTRLLDRLRQVTRQIVGLSMDNRPAQSKSDPRDVPDEIRTLSAERDDLERQLTERSAVYRTIQARALVGSGEVRAALPKGSALIDLVDYFHVGPPAKGQTEPSEEQRMVAFVVRPERQEVVIVPLGPSQALAWWIDRWRAYYGAGKTPPAGETDPGAELRKRLWEPLAAHLEGVKVVLVSPDGPLHGLPWAALPGSHPGTFLVHEYAFAVVPVPQLLPELLRGKPRLANQQPSLLLAGGIDFGEANTRDQETPAGKLPPVPVYRPLAGTESEVNDLEKRFRRTFPQAPPPLVLGEDQATKQAILAAAPAHRFLHLATHGFFAGESESSILLAEQRAALERGDPRLLAGVAGRHPGLLSGLVFAGVNRSDRRPEETILTALEAAELELGQVELVVLSACNTGRGQVAGGEGVLGLQRAFQLAGARSVVASLWRVPDEETHQLMREFYRRVWSDKPVPRAEALRQAQLWMLENWKPRGGLERPAPQGPPPPYVWAAFVLSGDWR